MKKQTKQVAWIVVMGIVAVLAVTKLKKSAMETCRRHFEETTGSEIRSDELEVVLRKTVFPSRFDKRYRAGCTYRDVTVTMEAKPLKPWHVIWTDKPD